MLGYRSEDAQFWPSSHRSRSVGGVPIDKIVVAKLGEDYRLLWTGETSEYLANVGLSLLNRL